jgi:hypothetical protein
LLVFCRCRLLKRYRVIAITLRYIFALSHKGKASTLERKVIAYNSYRSGLIELVISSYRYRSGTTGIVTASYSYRSRVIRLSLPIVIPLTDLTFGGATEPHVLWKLFHPFSYMGGTFGRVGGFYSKVDASNMHLEC